MVKQAVVSCFIFYCVHSSVNVVRHVTNSSSKRDHYHQQQQQQQHQPALLAPSSFGLDVEREREREREMIVIVDGVLRVSCVYCPGKTYSGLSTLTTNGENFVSTKKNNNNSESQHK